MKYCLFSLLLVFTATTAFAQSKVSNFSRIEIDGPAIIELVAADQAGVQILESEELVEWEINGESLVVMARSRKGYETVKVRIAVTELKALETYGSVALIGEGVFATRNLELAVNSQSVVTLEIDVEALEAKANDQSVVRLSGAADDFQLAVNNQSVVNAKRLSSGTIDAVANNQSVVNLNRTNAKINVQARNQSVID